MRIALASVFVDDQDRALRFYTEVLGFEKRADVPVGEFKWLTVGSPESPGVELLLEPNDNPAARTFQAALYEQGIPATSFASDDVVAEYERLAALGVRFRSPPADAGGTTVAVFDDTCGNFIGIHEG